ncbi:MAG: hypothetical protein IKI58_11040 [Oscillospiraceae bacterium]|nr:hypothetical protein [Oscillospiraceae bacterium]
MYTRAKRLLAGCLSVLISLSAVSSPVSAQTEEALSADLNGDGVVDVFDYVLSKRALVTEKAPVSISVSETSAAPGTQAVVCVDISGNPGCSDIEMTVEYDSGLLPYESETGDPFVEFGEELVNVLTAEPDYDTHSIRISADPDLLTSDDGTLFRMTFLVPADAALGTAYPVSISEVSLLNAEEKPIPVLTERGKVTVTPLLSGPADPQPPVITGLSTTATAPYVTETVLLTTETTTAAETSFGTTTETTACAVTETTETTTIPAELPAETTTTFVRKGIDISAWQGQVDFDKVAADPNVEFIILRAGHGKYLKQKDTMFEEYYDKATAAGIPVGAYWFSYAMTPEDARIEANVFMQVLGDRKFEYPIVLDIEAEKQMKLTKEEASEIVIAYCDELEKHGYYAMVYSFTNFLNNYLNDTVFRRFDVWCAHTKVSKPTFKGKYGIWQYSWEGKIDGINANVDMDYCYKDYPEIIKNKHLNGY